MPNTSIIVKEGPIETVTLDDIKSNKIIYYVIDGWHRVNALRDLADAKLLKLFIELKPRQKSCCASRLVLNTHELHTTIK